MSGTVAGISAAILGLLAAAGYAVIRSRRADIWLGPYLMQILTKDRPDPAQPVHVYFTLADHFEPFHGGASREVALRRVSEWCRRYPEIARRFTDSDGRHPRHTIFYPLEKYDPEIMDMLATRCREGFFDVEVHLHHDQDTAGNLRQQLEEFRDILHGRHGLLRRDPETGRVVYGFVHGNWALDNSSPDGKWCGVNNELTVLRETGCYADFTLPSAPSATQTRKINSVYYATDDPERPKSHDRGVDVRRGAQQAGDVMIIQGPLALDWRRRKFGFLPGLENGELTRGFAATESRVRLWIDSAPSVAQDCNRKFVKIHTHGCQDDATVEYLLTRGLPELYGIFCRQFNDGATHHLHFTSAYETYRRIKEAEGQA